MKFTWEPNDIECGRRVVAYNDTEQYIIGYFHAAGKEYCLLSGRDGLVKTIGTTKDDVAEHLNKGGYKPLTIDPFERPPLAAT